MKQTISIDSKPYLDIDGNVVSKERGDVFVKIAEGVSDRHPWEVWAHPTGHLVGYVGVSSNHPWFDRDEDEIDLPDYDGYEVSYAGPDTPLSSPWGVGISPFHGRPDPRITPAACEESFRGQKYVVTPEKMIACCQSLCRAAQRVKETEAAWSTSVKSSCCFLSFAGRHEGEDPMLLSEKWQRYLK